MEMPASAGMTISFHTPQSTFHITRQYLKPARENMQKMYEHKIVDVLDSNDKL